MQDIGKIIFENCLDINSWHFKLYACQELRVPPGVDFDVLTQSHCPLINKEPVCVRPPKPYFDDKGDVQICQDHITWPHVH